MVYLDGLVSTDAESLLAFQERFLRRQPQLDPVLDALSDVFIQLYDIFQPYCANLILSSSLEFLTGTAFEPQIKALTLDSTAKQFPWYLRELTGIAEGFSHLVFPMRLGINVLEYVKAIPDMCRWLNLTNGLLSSVAHFRAEDPVADRECHLGSTRKSSRERLPPMSTCGHWLRTETRSKCSRR